MRFQTLEQWLCWQERLHPDAIDLGLERVRQVWGRLRPGGLQGTVITVAGTNGKGSSVALLEAIYRAAGYRVGAYTSPHLMRYNERIRLDGEEVDDEAICRAFECIDQAREDVSLTYFEFGTLAALEIFAAAGPDVVLLEVGLGGRLDAVNIVDPDLALITPIGLDHADWLGHDRDSIGREKAGIMRERRPVVCTDADLPDSVRAAAERRNAPLYRLGHEFDFHAQNGGWRWQGPAEILHGLPRPALHGDCQLQNAAGALMAIACLQHGIPVTKEDIAQGLRQARLPGRLQRYELPGHVGIEVVLDVAHNPHAAQALARHLRSRPVAGRTLAIYAALADKDVQAVAGEFGEVVDQWLLAGLDVPRGLAGEALTRILAPGLAAPVETHQDVEQAWFAALARARPGDRLLGFGSFHTVAGLQRLGLQ